MKKFWLFFKQQQITKKTKFGSSFLVDTIRRICVQQLQKATTAAAAAAIIKKILNYKIKKKKYIVFKKLFLFLFS